MTDLDGLFSARQAEALRQAKSDVVRDRAAAVRILDAIREARANRYYEDARRVIMRELSRVREECVRPPSAKVPPPGAVTWVWSDLHLRHPLLTRLRGFGEDRDAHDAWLAKLWDEAVSPHDVIYLLGDLSFAKPRRTAEWFFSRPGLKFLVAGNHDSPKQLRALRAAGVEVLPPIHYLDFAGRAVVLCHYPFATWKGAGRGALHLHGHSHGNLHRGDERTTRTDVGVDGHWGPGPVKLVEVVDTLSRRRYRAVDHHEARKP